MSHRCSGFFSLVRAEIWHIFPQSTFIYLWKKLPFSLPEWFAHIIHKFTNFSNDISVCNQETFERMFLFYRLTILNSLLTKLVVVGSFLAESNSQTMSTCLLAQISRLHLSFFSLYFRTAYCCFIAHCHRPQRLTGKKRNMYSIKLVLSSHPSQKAKTFQWLSFQWDL